MKTTKPQQPFPAEVPSSGFQDFRTSELSKPRFMRRSHVLALLGITDRQMTKLVDSQIITPIHLTENGRAYYSRSQIQSILAIKTLEKIKF